jgi:ATP-dependent RNA helicase RhlE
MPFRVFGLEASILKGIHEAGYTEPTSIQSAPIPLILAGHDLIGIAQTGTGKTAAFVWPIRAKLDKPNRHGRTVAWPAPAPTSAPGPQIEEIVRAYGRHRAQPPHLIH